MKLGVRKPVNKLSEPRHRNRDLHHQTRHGRDSKCDLLVTTLSLHSEEEEDYPEHNVKATYTKAKFASIQPIIQKQTVRMEIEPRPTRTRAG